MEEAKIKAEQLLEKYLYLKLPNEKGMCPQGLTIIHAKQCALICVDEIIEQIEAVFTPLTAKLNSRYLYWQEVKKEINLL